MAHQDLDVVCDSLFDFLSCEVQFGFYPNPDLGGYGPYGIRCWLPGRLFIDLWF
jgi:hypothetical protein